MSEIKDYNIKLIDFFKSKKRMPSYSEMLILFNFKSKNAVYRVINKLIEAGIITKDSLGKILPSENFYNIPLVGLVKAGSPSQGDSLTDTLNIDDYLIKKREETYLLTVEGDSMIEAHIEEGDIVVVEKSQTAKDGDIVIAQVDGEFTMKFFKKKDNKTWLEPANKKYKPIYPEYELSVIGIVKGVMRKY